MPDSEPTLKVEKLHTSFFTKAGIVKAVNDVSFSVKRGEILGLVGESGSGKSITAFSILNLIDPPGRITSGKILFNGRDLVGSSEKEMQQLRGNKIAMIFQDPMMTLNPVLRIDTQMIETIQAHEKVSHRVAYERARDGLGRVGISSPEERLKAYPHQFSGGMRQRVAIAISFLLKPDLVLADEPTTALDVTIQGQILYEVQKLCRETGTAMVWITHDLAVVGGLADRVCVMYAGRIVEEGGVDEVIDTPMHPYTHGLIGSVPSQNRRGQVLYQIPGMTPSLLSLPKGCTFRPRCTQKTEQCLEVPQTLRTSSGRMMSCYNPFNQGL
ncbi:MAG: ABC transporter ATP-binding protein [SAR324 cluster bacterium]|nr:ABC transporter ATP-binding protein [SAR324 cluster bacterium]